MSYAGIRSGVFATHGGVEYASTPPWPDDTVIIRSFAEENPDPARFERNQYLDAWQTRVPVAELDRLYQANAYARYQGHRVNVTSVDESGQAEIYLADGHGLWASNNDFVQVDKNSYTKKVPAAELRDVHEDQHDLLFRQWRQANFTQPQGVR